MREPAAAEKKPTDIRKESPSTTKKGEIEESTALTALLNQERAEKTYRFCVTGCDILACEQGPSPVFHFHEFVLKNLVSAKPCERHVCYVDMFPIESHPARRFSHRTWRSHWASDTTPSKF